MRTNLVVGFLSVLVAMPLLAQQSSVSANDVCIKISSVSTTNAAECARLVSQNRYDQGVLDVSYGLANNGISTSALQVLRDGANRYLQFEAAKTCANMIRISQANTVACVSAALDGQFSPDGLAVVDLMTNQGASTSAVEGLRKVRNAYVNPQASKVCGQISRNSSANAAVCLGVIANKDFRNGTESICMNLANQGNTSSAVDCLKNIAADLPPAPAPQPPPPPPVVATVTISMDQLRNLKQAGRMADRALRVNDTYNANLQLNNINWIIDEIQRQNGIPQFGGRLEDGFGGRRH